MRARPASSRWISVPIAGGLFAALLLVFQTPAPARAQDAGGGGDWAISFSSGFAKPEGGAFGSQWKRGTSVLLGVAGQMSSHFEFGGEFGYTQFKPKGTYITVPGITPLGDNAWQMWRLRFHARRFFVSQDTKFAPFVSAGLGVYPITVQSEDTTGTFKITLSGAGVSVGTGADFRAGETVHFGLEGQYHYVRTNRDVVSYKASPVAEIMLAIRWFPGGKD